MPPTVFKNLVLQRLGPEVIQRLDLKQVDLPVGREIEYPGNAIRHLIFIEEGMASTTTTFADGFQVEVALGGQESVLGAASLMGIRHSLNRVYMQIPGHGYSCHQRLGNFEFRRGEDFHDLTLRAMQAQFIQAAQTAGCNARHTVEQRLARWLLLCADRNGQRILPLSQEYMADMLGVSRTSVNAVAGKLHQLGLIDYSRAKVTLIDLPGLETLSCECYKVVRDYLQAYIGKGSDSTGKDATPRSKDLITA